MLGDFKKSVQKVPVSLKLGKKLHEYYLPVEAETAVMDTNRYRLIANSTDIVISS